MPSSTSASRVRDSIFPDQVLYLGARPAHGARFVSPPEPAAVALWLERAEAHRDECLARFDLTLVAGKDAGAAAREILAGFLTWTRWSAGPFAKGPNDELARVLRVQEQRVWDVLADAAAARATRDAAAVDRFLDVWLTVVHEAVRTGNAPLYAAAD